LSRERGREAADVFGRILLRDPENAEARGGLEQARAAVVEVERVLATRLQEAEAALAAGEDEKARGLLDEIIRNGGDRDRARDLLDRLDRRPGRLHAGRGLGTWAGEAEEAASAASPAWSRRVVVGGWVLLFGLLATGVASSWDRLLDRLGRAPLPNSQPAPPTTSLASPSPGERAVADARRLLDQGETAAALTVLDRISPDEPAYPFARELRRQAEASLLSGGRGR
jgi:hypothetical protein